MANTFAPFGFDQYKGTGAAPTFEQVPAAIATANTTPIFSGDPVVQAANSTGIGTGYITQYYGSVPLAASAIATSSAGVLTVTFTTGPTSSIGTVLTGWAPPVGSTLVISGNTAGINGAFTVTSASATTAVVANSGLPVSLSSSTGTVTVFVPVAGIFVGCKYLSTSQKRTVWSAYWPGSDANGDVLAYVISDPNAQFLVQTGNSNTTATAVGLSAVGQNINVAWNDSTATGETNGNTASGQSTMFADQRSLVENSAAGTPSNAYLPFRVVSLANYVPGQTSPLVSVNGNDPTSGYNSIVVGFNNAMPRNFNGI